MRHERALLVLPKLIDAELGPIRRWLIGRHVARCASCMGILEDMQAVRNAVQTNVAPYRAPPGLAERIGMALSREVPAPEPVRKRLNFAYPSMSLAGAVAGIALTLMVVDRGPTPDNRLATDLVSSHVRSMMADHLMDVPTSDRHTVKPWLSAHMDFSPDVKDLVAAGYPLLGGRMDYIEGRETAAIVYRRDKHIINLFVFKQPGADTETKQSRLDGFNVITWREGGLRYSAVSDVEASQLVTFVGLVRAG
jgi:anti-sigma factor RsiW